MIKDYFEKVKKYLYEKNILPLIIKEKHLTASELEEITELMKPVPYEQIADKLPTEFGRAMKSISDSKNYQ